MPLTRDPASIGAGLASARPARTIAPGERIHVVGAAGAGASAAALLARWAGGDPSGCDPGGPSPYTAALDAAGIPLHPDHDASHVTTVPHPDRLAVTKALTAVRPDHPELQAARALGIPLEPWQQVVADAAAGRTLVAVAGTHGKSTTAGWLVHVLVAAGADPAAFVGALLPTRDGGGVAATARWGGGPAFIVEADEYAGNFDPYHPAMTLLTTVEWDHPDVFADRAAVLDAFERWLRRAASTAAAPPVLVANLGDPGVDELVARLGDWPGRLVATRLARTPAPDLVTEARRLADRLATAGGPTTAIVGRVTAADEAGSTLEIAGLGPGAATTAARIGLVGRHNAANALGVAGVAAALGVPPAAVATGLAAFAGVGRRLERKGEAAGVVVYDDYGHHPTAIRETLAALRQREPGRRTWAVYEPLTYHRTAAMLDAFADVLAEADAVAVAEIWAGRDPDTTITSAAALAEAVAKRAPGSPAAAPGTVEETARWLAGAVRPGDAVLVMGGGRSYRIAELLLEQLEAR